MNEMFVAHLYTQVKQAHEDIQQLTASKNTLREVKGELERAKEKVKEPELTSAIWVGFEDIRTAMLDEYDDLLTRQLTDAITTIDAKITALQSDIQGMERAIKMQEDEAKDKV